MDEINRQIMEELQQDGRLSMTELGRRVSLSVPAVKERVMRLEEQGVITGYHAKVDPDRVGKTVKAGLDTEDSVGIGGAIVRHGMKPRTVLQMALTCYTLAVLAGIYICANSSWWLAAIGIGGMLIGYLYTGGPLPIAYTPFGELFSGVSMGAAFVLIAFFIQTGTVDQTTILISIPIAILVGARSSVVG